MWSWFLMREVSLGVFFSNMRHSSVSHYKTVSRCCQSLWWWMPCLVFGFKMSQHPWWWKRPFYNLSQEEVPLTSELNVSLHYLVLGHEPRPTRPRIQPGLLSYQVDNCFHLGTRYCAVTSVVWCVPDRGSTVQPCGVSRSSEQHRRCSGWRSRSVFSRCFFHRHERGDFKKKVWKPFLPLTRILHSKQMIESIWDESK